jgi:effector-binding domain-containing protein
LLDEDPRGRTMQRLLEMRRLQSQRQIEEERQRLADVEARLRDLAAESRAPALDVVVQEIPPLRVASRRARVAELDDAVQELFEGLEADVARAGARAPGPPLLLYHDRDYRESDADVEAAVPVVEEAIRGRGLGVRVLPGIPRAACVTYSGSYAQWAATARALLAWLQARRLSPGEPLREVYLQFGAREAKSLSLPPQFLTDRAEELVTELQIPVSGAGAAGGRRPRSARRPARRARKS